MNDAQKPSGNQCSPQSGNTALVVSPSQESGPALISEQPAQAAPHIEHVPVVSRGEKPEYE